MCGENKKKTIRGSKKRPCKPEKTANGPVNLKLDFEVSACHTERAGGGGELPLPMVVVDLTAARKTIMGCRLVLYVFPDP